METRVTHVAFDVDQFDWYKNFFENVYGMEIDREDGEAPARRIWFKGGIQLNETEETRSPIEIFDHVCLLAEDVQGFVAKAIEAGSRKHPDETKGHWFLMPNGMQVEVMDH